MKKIPFARPYVGRDELRLLNKAVRSGWLTTGKLTLEFEETFAQTIKCDHALAVNSATAGLHLSLEAMGVGLGDKVITTPYTFTATAEVIRYLGAEPLFADIEENSSLIDPIQIRKLATQQGVKAIIPVHIAGEPCKIKEITQICLENDLYCLEDAAHAFPAKHKKNYLGSQSDVGVYSFYATKTLTTGEGGMVVTNNKKIADRIKIMRLHGINRDVWDRHTSDSANWEYDIVAPGYKYNLTDIASAIGLIQLTKAEKMLKMRTQIAKTYFSQLSDLPNLHLPFWNEDSSWHLFILQIQEQGSFEKNHQLRNKWIEKLAEKGIGTSVHYKPLHLMTYYKERYNFKPEDFPNSLNRYSRSFSLPIFPGMKKNEVQYIITTIRELVKNGI